MSIDWLSGLLLTALIFVPLERVLALHREQKVFRRGWLNDVIYLLLNAQVTMLGLGLLVVAIIVIAGWLMPVSLRAAVATQPYWAQIIEMIVLSTSGSTSPTGPFTRFPGCGNSIPSTTASKSSTGSPPPGFIRWIKS
jgi:sterol desaturase/sphingolipid hydroxylase (fatty acid hydroxylase superfamily)